MWVDVHQVHKNYFATLWLLHVERHSEFKLCVHAIYPREHAEIGIFFLHIMKKNVSFPADNSMNENVHKDVCRMSVTLLLAGWITLLDVP
jgi:hypothetical protein